MEDLEPQSQIQPQVCTPVRVWIKRFEDQSRRRGEDVKSPNTKTLSIRITARDKEIPIKL